MQMALRKNNNNKNHTPNNRTSCKELFQLYNGGKDLCVLFAMAIGCHSQDVLDHKEPPFSQSKVYHSEVKRDVSSLKLEVTRCWKAYMKSGRQPRP